MADNQPQESVTTNQPSLAEALNPELKSQDKSPEEVNPLAEQFSRVAKQERFVAEERKKIEEAKKAFESDKQEIEKFRGLKSKDPFEILEHFGISYEQLVEADKNRSTTPMDPMARKALERVNALEAQLQAEKRATENEKLSRAEIKLQSDIDTVIRTNDYDLIEKLGEQSLVREHMEKLFNETGVIPDIKEACEVVTERLVERFTKIKDSKWLKPKESKEAPVEVSAKPAETLSNRMTQTRAVSDKPLTEAQRMKAAIEALNNVQSK